VLLLLLQSSDDTSAVTIVQLVYPPLMVPEKLCHWCYHGVTSCPVLVELLEGEFKIWVPASVCKSRRSQIERDMPTYWGRVFATNSSIASGWNILAKIHGCTGLVLLARHIRLEEAKYLAGRRHQTDKKLSGGLCGPATN
jgi:hypothetical protein